MAPKKPGRSPAKGKAKAKATTAAPAPAAPVRRSSRQATKSAKAVEDEIVVAPARVTKKAAPKKKAPPAKATPAKPAAKKAAPKKPAPTKSAPAKPAAKKAAPAKAAAKKPAPKRTAATGAAPKKTGAPKPAYAESDAETTVSEKSDQRKADFRNAFAPSKASAPAKRPAKTAVSKTAAKKPAAAKKTAAVERDSAAPPSPKRGRPRKTKSDASTTSKASATSGVTKTTRTTRKKPAAKKPEVAAPDENEDWTDSPKKTSPKKRQSKLSTKSAATVKKMLEVREHEHRVGEESRAASVGGVKKSIEPVERATTKRHRSKSPARGVSKSPARRTTKASKGKAARGDSVPAAPSGRTRSQSPAKKSKPRQTSEQAARDADQLLEKIGEDLSDATKRRMTRQRTTSPAKGVRSKSPAKGRNDKGLANSASRNASRSPSANAVPKPLRVQKNRPRSSRSPSKNKSTSPRGSNYGGSPDREEGTESPVFAYGAEGVGEVIPERVARTRSPESKWLDDVLGEPDPMHPDADEDPRLSRSPSRASSVMREFNYAFYEDDEYGEVLRSIEADAYQSTKNGQELVGRADLVTELDQYRAQQRGIQRAEDEEYMRTFDGSAGKLAKRAKPTKPKKRRRPPGGPPSSGKRTRRGSDYRPPDGEDNDDDDDDDDVYPGNAPPKRPAPAPARKGRTNSASAYRPAGDEGDDEDEDIDAVNGSSGRSGSMRRRRANSQGAYRPVDGEDDDQDFDELGRPFRQSNSLRKSPTKKGSPSNGAANSKRRSPATVRKQGGWLGNKSRPSLLAKGKSTAATSPATAEKNLSPAREGQSPAKRGASTATKAGRSQSAYHRTASPERGPNDTLPPDQPSAPGRGTIRSVTNPEMIPGTKVKNPLFETMPGPEIWHRNMPPVFPYGETPFIQREMSRRIDEDLAGEGGGAKDGAEESPSMLSRVISGLGGIKQKVWPSPARQLPPAWELPAVSDTEVEEAVQEMNRTQRSASGTSNARKRKAATEARSVSPRKRARSRSTGGRRSA